MTDTHALLCARDPVVVEAVEVIAAAQQVELRHARDADESRQWWAGAALRLVATEVAARWTSVPPGRAFLVGADAAELARCSADLGLPVLPLPDGGGRLAEALAGVRSMGVPNGRLISLVGASGGLGVSTLAVGIAMTAPRGTAAAVVDLAPSSGGLDLLMGIESAEGARWSQLAAARGELGDLAAGLPSMGGVPVVTQDREGPRTPTPEAVTAVVGALRRQHTLVVMDGPAPPLVAPDRTLLVVGADVRSVAAARMRVEAGAVAPSELVVRRGRGRNLPAAVVGRALGMPVVCTVDDDRAVPRLAELGLPPADGPARRFTRQVRALARELCGD